MSAAFAAQCQRNLACCARFEHGAHSGPQQATQSSTCCFNKLGVREARWSSFAGQRVRHQVQGRSVGIYFDKERRKQVGVVRMGIKAVENFNTAFDLDSVAEEVLLSLLKSDVFAKQVATQPGVPPDCEWEFSGKLFQPVPWSVNTKFGMPQEYEQFLHDKENYVVLNVPPNYMFQAKVFKPPRLCAIFQRKGLRLEGDTE